MSACASNACSTTTSYLLLSGKSHTHTQSHTLTHTLKSCHTVPCQSTATHGRSQISSSTFFSCIYSAKLALFFLQLSSLELLPYHLTFYLTSILPSLRHFPSSLSSRAFLFSLHCPYLSFFLPCSRLSYLFLILFPLSYLAFSFPDLMNIPYLPSSSFTSSFSCSPSFSLGTSMACPHVTGVVAQLLEKNHLATPADVQQAISCDGAKGN